MRPIEDPRHISRGLEIPTETYSDQPYLLRTDDGAWLCVVTTGPGLEGQSGQHVVTVRSTDRGASWTRPVDVEPSSGPEASYAVLLKGPAGRIYCFYNHNTDNLRRVKGSDPPFAGGWCTRVDSLGHFVFRYSDDHGRSWSPSRCEIPIRRMAIDRANPYGGELMFFWNVGRAFVHEGAAYVPLHKVGGYGQGFFIRSEGVFLRSPDLLGASDPARATWETLPEGDAGLRTPPGGGPVAEEQCCVPLSDGTLFVVYRSIDGHPVCATSRDGGRRWTTPRYLCFAEGRRVKNPRAANFVWRTANGRYLYWFHNHGGKTLRERCAVDAGYGYQHRNPVWLSGGVEVDGPEGRTIAWSEPEIALYDDDQLIRMSYPDLVEEDGRLWLTETQKDVARAHEVDPRILRALWAQHERAEVAREGLLLERLGDRLAGEVPMPELPRFVERDLDRTDRGGRRTRAGISLECAFELSSLEAGQTLLDSRTPEGEGLCLRLGVNGTVELLLCDGQTAAIWDTDPGAVRPGCPHHLVAVADGGPGIISFVLDGRLLDGGDERQFGWGRFSPHLMNAAGSDRLRIAPRLDGAVSLVRLYGRALLTSEAVGNRRAWLAARDGRGGS
jgi:hypothetical protein